MLPTASHSRLCAGDHLRLLENGKKGWGEKATPVLSAAALCECCFCHPIEKPSGAEEEKEKPSFFLCVCVPKVRLWCIRCERPLFEKVCFYTPLLNWYATSNGATQESQTLFAVFCAFRVRFFFFCVFRLRKLKTALLHMKFHFFLSVLSPPSLFPLFLFFFLMF